MTTGGGVFDNLLMFNSSTNVTRGTTYAPGVLKIRGTPAAGLGVRVLFPETDGTTVKVLPEIYASADNSTYRLVSVYPGGHVSFASGQHEVNFKFAVPRSLQYVKMYFAFATGTTASSFGAVKAGIVPSDAYADWSRAAQWT